MQEIIKILIAAVVTFFITFALNKFFSLFRYRQLYATIYDDIEDVYSGGRRAKSSTIVIGNKGKDKECDVELFFKNTCYIEIISCDSLGAVVDGNCLKIDRILPGERVRASVIIEGDEESNSKKNVMLRSADAKGSLFFKYGREPVGLGPVILTLSFLAVFVGWMGYGIVTGVAPDHLYNKARYWSLYEKGFELDGMTAGRLMKGISPTAQKHPIEYIESRKKDSYIILVFEVENTTLVAMKASAEVDIEGDEYEERRSAAYRILDNEKRDDAIEELWADYGEPIFRYKGSEALVEPGSTSRIVAIRKHGKISSGLDFVVRINVEFEDGSSYGDMDRYLFIPTLAGINEGDIKLLSE